MYNTQEVDKYFHIPSRLAPFAAVYDLTLKRLLPDFRQLEETFCASALSGFEGCKTNFAMLLSIRRWRPRTEMQLRWREGEIEGLDLVGDR